MNQLKNKISIVTVVFSVVLGLAGQNAGAVSNPIQQSEGSNGNEAIQREVNQRRNNQGRAIGSQSGNSSTNSSSNSSGASTNTNQSNNQNNAQNNTQNSVQNQNSTSTGTKKCGNTETTIIGCDPENGESAIITLLKMAIKILYMVIGILSVVMIMIAGAIYAMAGDSEEKVKTAKTMIKNTMIGIFLYVFMTVILNFLIPGGVF